MKTGNVMFSGQTWQLWAGTPTADQHGPLLLYWHGTGSTSGEPTFTIGQAQIDAITAEGGLVASPQTTTRQGNTTNNNVWYTNYVGGLYQAVPLDTAESPRARLAPG